MPACANGGLITEIARGTFGFQGFVMSDYDAWEEMVSTHGWAKDYATAAAAGLAAGLDQEGGGGPTYPPVQSGIPAALAAGTVTVAQLETAVRRLMKARLRLGMFDPPASLAYNFITHAEVASAAHLVLAEKAARAGVTLLKNNARALPLALSRLAGKTVAVLGPNANASYPLLGSYSDPGCCTTGGIPSLLDELSARLTAAGVGVAYAPGCPDANCATDSGFADAAAAAADASAVVVMFGTGTPGVLPLFPPTFPLPAFPPLRHAVLHPHLPPPRTANSNYDCGGAKNRDDCEAEDWDRPTCRLPGMQPELLAAIR